jgi:hypothetical protein
LRIGLLIATLNEYAKNLKKLIQNFPQLRQDMEVDIAGILARCNEKIY